MKKSNKKRIKANIKTFWRLKVKSKRKKYRTNKDTNTIKIIDDVCNTNLCNCLNFKVLNNKFITNTFYSFDAIISNFFT